MASSAEITMPTAGTPRPDNATEHGREQAIRAAAIGTWPIIRVQPLSAPIDERITARAMTPPPQGAPHARRAASLNGAIEPVSCSRGTTPNTTTVPST